MHSQLAAVVDRQHVAGVNRQVVQLGELIEMNVDEGPKVVDQSIELTVRYAGVPVDGIAPQPAVRADVGADGAARTRHPRLLRVSRRHHHGRCGAEHQRAIESRRHRGFLRSFNSSVGSPACVSGAPTKAEALPGSPNYAHRPGKRKFKQDRLVDKSKLDNIVLAHALNSGCISPHSG